MEPANSKPKDIGELVRCINQAFRPTTIVPQEMRPGIGNCLICTYDPENNPKCRGYYPIKLITFYVKDNV